MDNLRTIVKMLYRQISPLEILDGGIDYDKISEKSIIRLSNIYMPQYSNDEIKNMVDFLKNEFEWQNNRIRGEEHSRVYDGINVFDAMFVLSKSILIEEDGMPLCRYENLLRWRDVTLELDEDLMVTSFLAYKDVIRGVRERNFFWPPVIGHNNFMINRMLERGIAENHFHLKGSAPLFHLSWISMMNDITNKEFYNALKEYDERRLNQNYGQSIQYPHRELREEYPQAALIRLFLFCKLHKRSCTFLRRYAGAQNDEEEYQAVMNYLRHPEELWNLAEGLQESICEVKAFPDALDYAICEGWLLINPDRHLNETITGERYFLYMMYQKIYMRDEKFLHYGNLFYIYIIIKANIRTEMVQSNQNVGFDNFRLYQDRKEYFIDNTPFEPVYIRMAVRDTILNQHIYKLEARITPRATESANAAYIKKLDDWISGDLSSEEEKRELKKKYFYVYHFIKEPDIPYISGEPLQKRHEKTRERVKQQALAIAGMRKNSDYAQAALRLKGIDACSPEIDCRPEVFAQAFRFLKEQNIYERFDEFDIYRRLPNLKATYHVGEDNYDVIDGLRAIDEAVFFLNLRCGDRLGHALALGINIEEWYAGRAFRILIPRVNYLDNLVWLYSKIRKFHLSECTDALSYIEKRYDELFRTIYLDNISSDLLNRIVQEASSYFENKEIRNNYINCQFRFTINTYYDAWKLRGDDPEYFRKGYFRLDDIPVRDVWDSYGINKNYPDNYRVRYNPEAALLNYLYHFNAGVREEGRKVLEIRVNPCIIKAAIQVQNRMQKLVCDKGIAIETNPSSNYLIGSFKRYDKHPIVQWYNLGLTHEYTDLLQCPQIQVSINTDDQGVFATSLENEYALMALALEKAKASDGSRKYNRTMICQWLDNIREMGIAQSFG